MALLMMMMMCHTCPTTVSKYLHDGMVREEYAAERAAILSGKIIV